MVEVGEDAVKVLSLAMGGLDAAKGDLRSERGEREERESNGSRELAARGESQAAMAVAAEATTLSERSPLQDSHRP